MSEPQHNAKSVSQLTREIKDLIEANLDSEWVSGEVSNCRPARSGHVYFTLKDESSQIPAVAWRSTAARLGFELQDGMELVVAGRVEVYQARGVYQLIAQKAFPQGVGTLELKLRQLRDKLESEGLFAPERKRPIPRIPRRIALVTSPTSAAVRDMLQVITRRWPAVDIVIVPVAVQGAAAAPEIAAALNGVHQIPGVDVVITGRGGGSLEDLWAFNEEIVARAIAGCPVPVISAVGHEIDVSIADLVADRRALTPSEAAELVVPDRIELSADLESLRERLVSSLRQRAVRARLQVDALATRRVLTDPQQRIRQLSEYVDELGDRMTRAAARRVDDSRRIAERLGATLHSLSPLAVLTRGYSMTFRGDFVDGDFERGDLITDAAQVVTGDLLQTSLRRGHIVSRIESTEPELDDTQPATS
jgi:exodeoxyribonuclease VII large subunit